MLECFESCGLERMWKEALVSQKLFVEVLDNYCMPLALGRSSEYCIIYTLRFGGEYKKVKYAMKTSGEWR
jgi:hypothetical protein